MNKESVEIINRLRAILQDSWVNELPDNEKIAVRLQKTTRIRNKILPGVRRVDGE